MDRAINKTTGEMVSAFENAKIWEDFKIWCIKHKISISEKLDELIREVLKSGK